MLYIPLESTGEDDLAQGLDATGEEGEFIEIQR